MGKIRLIFGSKNGWDLNPGPLEKHLSFFIHLFLLLFELDCCGKDCCSQQRCCVFVFGEVGD